MMRSDGRNGTERSALEVVRSGAGWARSGQTGWRGAFARQVDATLVSLGRGRCAREARIGEKLASLAEGDRLLRLGYARLGDYGRERLGMSVRSTQAAARLGRTLRDRPLLRRAVFRGEVSARKALTVATIAEGSAEALWVDLARETPVRKLEALVRGMGGVPGEDDEVWEALTLALSPEQRARVDEAIALARKLEGATLPRWRALQAMGQEYLAEFVKHGLVSESEDSGEPPVGGGIPHLADEVEETVIAGYSRESVTHKVEDPFVLDEDLRAIILGGERDHALLGKLARMVRQHGLWRLFGHGSFESYCRDRLGLSARTVRQRIWLEERMLAFPAIRKALGDGRITYSKALILAREAEATNGADLQARLELAQKTPCLDLKREMERREDRQMCARGQIRVFGPPVFLDLLIEAIGVARRRALATEKVLIDVGEALARIADHFVATWASSVPHAPPRRRRVLGRDDGRCNTPGCSNSAHHLHHVLFRSRGGGDSEENLVGLCATHHLHCLHLGWMRVEAVESGRMRWELGVRSGREPLEVFIRSAFL